VNAPPPTSPGERCNFLAEMSSLPYRQGLLPSVRAFVEHLAAEFPKPVRI
jgi:hypothetical protein